LSLLIDLIWDAFFHHRDKFCFFCRAVLVLVSWAHFPMLLNLMFAYL